MAVIIIASFHTSVSWWSLPGVYNDNKFPPVSRTFLSILADLNNAIVWMVSIRTQCPTLPAPLSSLWGTFQGCQLHRHHQHFHVLQLSQFSGKFFSSLFLFSLCDPLGRQSPQFGKFSFFFSLLIIIRFDYLVGITWLLSVSYHPYRVFTQDLGGGNVEIIYILFFFSLLGAFFPIQINSALPRRWAISQRVIFCTSCWWRLPGILFMFCFNVSHF